MAWNLWGKGQVTLVNYKRKNSIWRTPLVVWIYDYYWTFSSSSSLPSACFPSDPTWKLQPGALWLIWNFFFFFLTITPAWRLFLTVEGVGEKSRGGRGRAWQESSVNRRHPGGFWGVIGSANVWLTPQTPPALGGPPAATQRGSSQLSDRLAKREKAPN